MLEVTGVVMVKSTDLRIGSGNVDQGGQGDKEVPARGKEEVQAGEMGAEQAAALLQELHELAQTHPHTAPIRDILIHPSLPVDIRHNAKIFREKLAAWAAVQLPQRQRPTDAAPDHS